MKVTIDYSGNDIIWGKVFRVHDRHVNCPRSDKTRVVHYCTIQEPILPNGDLPITMLRRNGKYYEEVSSEGV